jgi:hypothetical protein
VLSDDLGVVQLIVFLNFHLAGSDGVNDGRRMFQCFVFMRDPRNPQEADSNHYAFPLTTLFARG